MKLSFIEQAALDFFKRAYASSLSQSEALAVAVNQAGLLASCICEKFGHDEQPFYLDSPGAGTLVAGGATQKCARCGKVVKP